MCVVKLGKRVKGPVVAWKIIRRINKQMYGIVMDFKYKINKIHAAKSRHGFQAFVNKEDAEGAINASQLQHNWLHDCEIRKVFLYAAAKGTIQNMDSYSNGKLGWSAKKIRIPKKTNG